MQEAEKPLPIKGCFPSTENIFSQIYFKKGVLHSAIRT